MLILPPYSPTVVVHTYCEEAARGRISAEPRFCVGCQRRGHHVLLRRSLQSLHCLRTRLWAHMPSPPQSLQSLLRQLCWQMQGGPKSTLGPKPYEILAAHGGSPHSSSMLCITVGPITTYKAVRRGSSHVWPSTNSRRGNKRDRVFHVLGEIGVLLVLIQ